MSDWGRYVSTLHDVAQRTQRQYAAGVIWDSGLTAGSGISPFAMTAALRNQNEAMIGENAFDLSSRQSPNGPGIRPRFRVPSRSGPVRSDRVVDTVRWPRG